MKIYFTSKNLVTGLAGVFALVSVQNVAHFFIELDHPWPASWTLGLAIGAALVILAHQLSEIDMREHRAFYGLLTVTLILVTLSGLIQGHEYAVKMGFAGYVLAFVLAATGEIVLPLAHSWTEEAKRRQAVNDAGQKVEEIAAETLIGVMTGVDTARAKKQAEKRIEGLVIAHVDSIVAKLMPTVDTPITHSMDAASVQSGYTTVNDAETSAPNADLNTAFGPDNLPAANEARSQSTEQRRAALLAMLRSLGKLNTSDLNKSELARELGTSARTISRDLDALHDSGIINVNGVVEVVA